jgi:hypothetical protein
MPSNETIRQYEAQLDDTEEVSTTFQRLRRDGHSRKEAVRILLALLDRPLHEAKEVLAGGATWAEARAPDAPSDETAASDDSPSAPDLPPAPG